MKQIIFSATALLFTVSCAPAAFTPYEPNRIQFEKTSPYSIQEELEKLPKPDKINKIYVKLNNDGKTITVVKAEEATHILLAPEEYSKVGAVVKLAGTYKTIVLEQEKLVNLYINDINALKELLTLGQDKSENYRGLWISSENAYRQEEYKSICYICCNNWINYCTSNSTINIHLL